MEENRKSKRKIPNRNKKDCGGKEGGMWWGSNKDKKNNNCELIIKREWEVSKERKEIS